MPPMKQQVIEMIQTLPDESTVDDIMAELYFRAKVDNGLKELDEGKAISHEAVKGSLASNLILDFEAIRRLQRGSWPGQEPSSS